MERFLGSLVTMLCFCLVLAATVHGTSLNRVYLKDGGVIECQKYWQRDGTVLVLVNRDVLVELAPDEVDMKRTFAKKPVTAGKKAKAVKKRAPVAKGDKVAGPTTPATPGATRAGDGKAAAALTPKATVQPPGAASQAPGQKPVTPPSPQKPAAPVPGAKPVSPGQGQPAAPAPAAPAAPGAKAPAAPAPAAAPSPASPAADPGRTTLPLVTSKPPAPVPPALGAMFGIGTLLPILLIIVLLIASLWKVFTKAGEAGWQSIIPLYNLFVLVKISGKPWWWFLLTFVPVVGIIVLILVHIALAQRFNKGVLFGLGLAFFGFIFLPVLAFGNATYE